MKHNSTSRNDSKRQLPVNIEPVVKIAAIEMRKWPRVIQEHDKTILYINNALVTVINPGRSKLIKRGMCFKISRKKVVAEKIKVKKEKYRGSQNHHKFLIVVYDALFQSIRNGGAAIWKKKGVN